MLEVGSWRSRVVHTLSQIYFIPKQLTLGFAPRLLMENYSSTKQLTKGEQIFDFAKFPRDEANTTLLQLNPRVQDLTFPQDAELQRNATDANEHDMHAISPDFFGQCG
jgi:hypothetical protein